MVEQTMVGKHMVALVVMEDHRMKEQIMVLMDQVEKDQVVEVEPVVQKVLQ